MPLTRKLTDLYVVGRDLTISDGKGDDVTVYIRKITAVDAEAAFRAANAAKAKEIAAKTDPDSLTFQIVRERSDAMTKDELVDQLAAVELERRRPVINAELEADEKWSKDDYLQGLHDAWESGLKKKHFTDPDEETKRVFDEMKAFDTELEKRLKREEESIRKNLSTTAVQKLRDDFFDEQFERQGDIAWLTEYRKQELFHAIRDPEDHEQRAFGDVKQIEIAAPKLIEELRAAYNELSVDGMEGKD